MWSYSCKLLTIDKDTGNSDYGDIVNDNTDTDADTDTNAIIDANTITVASGKQSVYKPISYYTTLIKTHSAGTYSWAR